MAMISSQLLLYVHEKLMIAVRHLTVAMKSL